MEHLLHAELFWGEHTGGGCCPGLPTVPVMPRCTAGGRAPGRQELGLCGLSCGDGRCKAAVHTTCVGPALWGPAPGTVPEPREHGWTSVPDVTGLLPPHSLPCKCSPTSLPKASQIWSQQPLQGVHFLSLSHVQLPWPHLNHPNSAQAAPHRSAFQLPARDLLPHLSVCGLLCPLEEQREALQLTKGRARGPHPLGTPLLLPGHSVC